MPKQFQLLEANPQLGLQDGIYRDENIVFRDTDIAWRMNREIPEIFSEIDDKSLFSLEIEKKLTTNELRDCLSLEQYSFVRTFDLEHVSSVLDLTQDFGGIAHYLSDHVETVEAYKLDPRYAEISSKRCADKHNVRHVSEDLDKLIFPEKHYDLIVIGYLEGLDLTAEQQTELFARLQTALSDNGSLVLNIANHDRLSKQFDPDSHAYSGSVKFGDLYHTHKESHPRRDIKRRDLRNELIDAGYNAIDFHACFSKGKNCGNLFSEDYLTASVDALNHFNRLGSIENPAINEFLLYKKLSSENKRLMDMANRYLVIAGSRKPVIRKLYDNYFTYFPGSGRKPHWRTMTSRRRADQQVTKTSYYPALYQAANTPDQLLQQNLQPQPFFKGHVLVNDWLQALFDGDRQGFEGLVTEYVDWLNEFEKDSSFTNTAYDMLPFNIIVKETKEGGRLFQTIDPEWQVNTQFSAEFILFRALFWFAFENKDLLSSYASENDFYTLGLFVSAHMPKILSYQELDKYVELEEQIQALIGEHYRADSVRQAMLQAFDSGSSAIADESLQIQALWGNANDIMDERHAVTIDWERTSQPQTIKLPLRTFDASQPILRIDPISCIGTFEINRVELFDINNKSLWRLGSAEEISQASEVRNALASTSSDEKTIQYNALNEDPHLLFDVTVVGNIEMVASLSVELVWRWGSEYSGAIATLCKTVNAQVKAMALQDNKLNTYRADNSFQTLEIKHLIEHRSDVAQGMLQTINAKDEHIVELEGVNDQLQDRITELYGYLMLRPSTRIKRLLTRTFSRLRGIDPDAPAIDESHDDDLIEQDDHDDDIIAEQPDESEAIDDEPKELIGQNTEDYGRWVAENSLSDNRQQAIRAEIESMENKPVFSILVPVYNTGPEYLIAMIRSVQNQLYPYWQLCLVDDCSPNDYLKQILQHEASKDERIHIQLNDVNQGISVCTNNALAMATGDYIALLDHDDELSIDALYENAKIINQTPNVGLIYSDEDKLDMDGQRLQPFFKPDYSPDLLHTNNYICHFTVIEKSIADKIQGFREGLDGSQDHDIILRAAEQAERIVHIPKILYHWRKIPGSTSVTYDSKSYAWEAGRRAVEDHLSKRESGVAVEFGSLKGTYRVRRKIHGNPLVSIIIPFKDKPELLKSCLDSILVRTEYSNFEVIGVSNNSEDPLTYEQMAYFDNLDSRVRFTEKNIPFNFSSLCNHGVDQANGQYIVLLNNDVEVISQNWIECLLEHAQQSQNGAIGGKLLYPDGRIQHAGIVVGMVGAAGHPHKFFPDQHIGYHGRLHMAYNVSAVTGAMMMVSKEKYTEVGGLDEGCFAVAYNDVDFCLKLMQNGYRNLFTPYCVATHHESVSRGYEDTDEKMKRLLSEQAAFLEKWADFLEKGDPYYNPNLSLDSENFCLNYKD